MKGDAKKKETGAKPVEVIDSRTAVFVFCYLHPRILAGLSFLQVSGQGNTVTLTQIVVLSHRAVAGHHGTSLRGDQP